MPKRLTVRLLNLLWYSTALAIVLAATVVAVGRELLPQINLDNPALARWVSERVNADIAVDDLRGRWVRLFPEFSARGVRISTPALSLELHDVRMEVDVLRSLWRRTPVFDRLELASAEVSYNGTDRSNGTLDADANWRTLNLLLNRNISVRNVTVNWQQADSTYQLRLQDLRVQQTLLDKRVFLRLLGSDDSGSLSLTGSLRGESLAASQGNLYLDLQGWPLHTWLPPRMTDSLPAPLRSWIHQPWLMHGGLWLDWQGIDKVDTTASLRTQVSPDPALSSRSSSENASPSLPREIGADASLRWQRGQNIELDMHRLQWQDGESASTALDAMRITRHPAGTWQLQAPLITLDAFASLYHRLPAGELKTLAESLNPRGELRQVSLLWDPEKPLLERMQLRCRVTNVATGAWQGVPAFTGVDGYVDSGIGYGFIDLDSRHGFSMHYRDLYKNPMPFERAAGRVQWQWLPEKKTALVGSDYASLSGDSGEARGNFWLKLALPGADFRGEMILAIGLRNSEARFRERYIPNLLPAELQAWLHNSIEAGQVADSGFLYRGPLFGRTPFSRAIQFYANMAEGQLRFDPRWPPLTALQAKLLVDDGEAAVRATSGQLYNTSIEGAWVGVTASQPGTLVTVNARARGYAEDGLRILRDTPLHQAIGNGLDSWRIPAGLLQANLQLQIPLAGATTPTHEAVQVSLFDTQLIMDDLRLQFDGIQGDVRYETGSGLSSPGLQTSLFRQPVSVSIASTSSGAGLSTRIDAQGQADASDIAAWSRLKPLQLLNGAVDYRASLALGPFDKTVDDKLGTLTITSELQQLALPLPAPLEKQAGQPAPLELVVDLYRHNRQDYRLRYNHQVSGALSLRDGQLFGGDISILGADAELPAAQGPLRIHGTLPGGDLQTWLGLVNAYNALPDDATGTAISPEFDIQLHDAHWKDLHVPLLSLAARHTNGIWQLDFQSDSATGQARFHDSGAITEIHLDSLVIPSRQDETDRNANTLDNNSANSGIGAPDFASIPPMNIVIKQMIYRDKVIGSLNTRLRSDAASLRLEDLLINGPGYRVLGAQDNTAAQLAWRRTPDGLYQSEFHGLLHMQGEQPALAHLGVDPFVRGENVYLWMDLAWAGSPASVTVDKLFGRVRTQGEKGKYLQAKANPAMQAIGVINIATWARRLRLDFSDLTGEGISFDHYEGELAFANGSMQFYKPLNVQSPSSAMILSGQADMAAEQLDLQLTATLPVSNNATWIAALAGGLPAAAGVYLVSKVFGERIENLTSLSYSIKGPMADPDIRFERIAAPKTGK